MPTFDDKGANRAETVAARFPHCLARNADPGSDRLVQPIKPRSRVKQIALSAIFQPCPGPDVADHRSAGMDSNSSMAKIDTPGLLLGAEPLSELVDGQRGTDGPIRMICLLVRGAEKCEHRVADEFGNHA